MRIGDNIQSADWKAEKHVPVISAPSEVVAGEKFRVTVQVGKEIPHPNTTEHHIRWIQLYFKPHGGKFVFDLGRFDFNAHAESPEGANKGPVVVEPSVECELKITSSGTLIAVSYCNIHGLWENSQEIVVKQ